MKEEAVVWMDIYVCAYKLKSKYTCVSYEGIAKNHCSFWGTKNLDLSAWRLTRVSEQMNNKEISERGGHVHSETVS